MAKKKLTKEEKQALKLEKKEAAARAKKQFKDSIKRIKLEKELKFTKEQLSDIRKKIMENAKMVNLPILKEEYLQKWQFFDRTVDLKDFYISTLMDDVYYFEKHHRNSENNHVENIEIMKDVYEKHMKAIYDDYLKKREELLKGREEWITRLVMTQQRRNQLMENAIYATDHAAKLEFRETRSKNQWESHKLFNEFSEAYEIIASEGDQIIDKIWNETKEFFQAYKKSTKTDRKKFVQDFQHDRQDQEEINELTAKLKELYGEIEKYTSVMEKLNEKRSRVSELVNEKHEAMKLQNDLRVELEKMDTNSKAKLLHLSNVSNEVIKNLKVLAKKAQTVYNLSVNCNKLLTEDEKIAPQNLFGPPPPMFLDLKKIEGLEDRVGEMLETKEMASRINHILNQNNHLEITLNQMLLEKTEYINLLKENIMGLATSANTVK